MFTTILNGSSTLTFTSAILCTVTSLVIGAVIALVYAAHGNSSKNMIVSLTLLPVLVQVVIMMVNGNLGAGVAVLGTFSLVRFRSLPGSSREISCIFFAMAIGLATGMGYLTFAVMIAVIVGGMMLLLTKSPLGNIKPSQRELKVTIPESLDYTEIFNDLFDKYVKKSELIKVKTTNLGSMYELTYTVTLKDASAEKQFIDDIRCRNGNLTVMCGRPHTVVEEL